MRYDRWYRPLATIFGIGPNSTTIRIDGDILHVRHGWAFRLDVPLQDIQSARPIRERPLTWGVHTTGDYWYVNGSRDAIVELTFARPVTSRSVTMQGGRWAEVCRLYLSLTDPDGFLAALQSRLNS